MASAGLRCQKGRAIPGNGTNSVTNNRVDVLVLGGGPAGAATALALRHRGRSVAVVERSDYSNPRIGETLPPAVREPLVSLGVWEKFLADKHAPSFGIQSAWGQADLYENDFIFNPHGPGWHIDRSRFDAMLVCSAEEAGVKLYRRARLMACAQTATGDWQIEIGREDRRHNVRARFVIDATGRASTFARRQGARRITCDQLVGIVGFFSPNSASLTPCSQTLVEAVEQGWWYSALLPDSRIVTAFMTDADLYARANKRSADYWQQQLRRAPHTGSRTKAYTPAPGRLIVAANTSRLDNVAGKNWLAVGDAAMALDPLSSLGVYNALKSGLILAQAIDSSLTGDATVLQDYAASVEADYDACLETRAQYYAAETRWPSSPFWQRRLRFLFQSPWRRRASAPRSARTSPTISLVRRH
jgi:flavin-dependent dehydrogenase